LLEELLLKDRCNVLRYLKLGTRIGLNGWPINSKIIIQMHMIGNLKFSHPLIQHQGTSIKLSEKSQAMPLGKPREQGKELEQSKTLFCKFKEKKSDKDMVVFGHTSSILK
jgi:hypothetical protein